MTIEEIIDRLPKLSAVMNETWLRRKCDWGENDNWDKKEEFIKRNLPWFEQIERDLTILEKYVGIKKLKSCYSKKLHNQSDTQKFIFEIHGAALLAKTGRCLDLHVPRGDESGKDFDVKAEIRGYTINAESKTRKDESLFNLPPKLVFESKSQIAGFGDILDIPESKGIKGIQDRLCKGLSQLPDQGYNVIIFGSIEGEHDVLEDALFG